MADVVAAVAREGSMTCPRCQRKHGEAQPCLVGVLLVCGGRDYSDWTTLVAALDRMAERMVVQAVRHGRARGADSLAGRWAAHRGLLVEEMPADWRANGRGAGPIRNAAMLVREPTPAAKTSRRFSWYVYLFERSGELKIGYSHNPKRRAANLQQAAGNGIPVVVLAKRRYGHEHTARARERELHELFAAHRIRGEWFEDVPEIRAWFGL